MALRFLLVSLVAGLGFELPKTEEMSSWVDSGRAWVHARLDDLSGARLVAVRDAADAGFSRVVEDLASSFTVDLATMSEPKVKQVLVFEPMTVPEDLETGAAFALNRDAQGVGFTPRLIGPPASLAIAPTPQPEAEPIAAPRASRLASAVRLTRQAAEAWASLLGDADGISIRR